MKRTLFILILLCAARVALAGPDGLRLTGKVVDAGTLEPVAGAVVKLDENYLWAVTDMDGAFSFESVQKGSYVLEASCLGYVSYKHNIQLKNALDGIVVKLNENTLALNEVVVTAESAKDKLNTTQKIERTAIDHLQMSGVDGIQALLPGGKTINPDLTEENSLSLRAAGTTGDDAKIAAFSTAVEVNGVRMGDNASFGELQGVGTRSLSVENIESVEVITGVPSAEYGDFGSGIIRVNTKKGRTPLNLVFAVNPRTYETSVSKGVELGKGVLNMGLEWTRATAKLASPYKSYTRRGFTLDYTHTFAKVLRLEAGMNGNIGGMNDKSDPDAFARTFEKVNDHLFTPHAKLTWLLNRSWVTNLSLEGSVYYHDRQSLEHSYHSYATTLPAVHATNKGYWLATMLPSTYYSDKVTDSRELDFAASLKYHWLRYFGPVKSVLKAGVQWKADGNVGRGEWYEDPALADHSYRPRPYTEYPYMHTISGYAEENITVPLGKTSLHIMAGLRMEKAYINGSQYDGLNMLSPRFNAKWTLSKAFSVRGGWGVAGKLPSFYILYPKREYRDIRTMDFSHGTQASYVYYTQPYTMQYNPDLKWQKNHNAELGLDLHYKGFKMGLVGFYNITKDPYQMGHVYTPFFYNIFQVPDGFNMTDNPEFVVDHQHGAVYLRDESGYFVPATLKLTDRSFAKSPRQENGADIHRYGVEVTLDFPEIKPIRTTFRLDAAWNHTEYTSTFSSYLYNDGWSHSTLPGRSYEYVGLYYGGTNVFNGRRTDHLNANLTAITHIPRARLVVSLRLEATLLRNAQNTSDRAFTVGESTNEPSGKNIYDGPSYTAVYPSAYMDLDGNVHPWTDESAKDPALQRLIIRSNNIYTFAADGYNPYMSANFSVTKEIGKQVSVSFFANNFTNARTLVTSRATGGSAIFTPDFYYGLRCRIKF